MSNEWGISSVKVLLNSKLPICCMGSICMPSTSNRKYVQNFFLISVCENNRNGTDELLKKL